MNPILEGAYDMHVHTAPDVIDRRMDDLDLAAAYKAAGMKGFVIKSHYFDTAGRAYLIRRLFPGLRAVGAIVLNRSVGGLNPEAVRMAAKYGAEVVYMPTVDAFNMSHMSGAIRMLADGGLDPAIDEILDIVRDYDMVLCSGHIAPEETLALFSDSDKAKDTLLILRGSESFTVTVGKSEVYAPYVSYEMVTDSVGYIKIDGFFGRVVSEMKNAMEALVSQGMQSVIIDVRDNPGGGLNESLEVSKLFLHKGDLIVTIMARNEQEESYSAKADGYDLPVTILVNKESASGSELFTAALRDNGRAVVVGKKTYGKGIVQSFFKIRANGGYVKITTDAYFTPKGVNIHHIGITPDIEVDLPEEYKDAIVAAVPREQDTQLDTAIRAAEYQIELNGAEDAA